jgi:hypothetical protein
MPLTTAEVSLFTKPEYEGVIKGGAEPKKTVGEEAVTVRGARVISSEMLSEEIEVKKFVAPE